jgi:hypothetical protein
MTNIPEDDTTISDLDPKLSLSQISETMHLSIADTADTADKLYNGIVWNGDDAARVWALPPKSLNLKSGFGHAR